jgi:hypothetical protein
MMESYTKLTVEIQYDDGERTKVELSRNAWDLDGDDMGRLFRQMMGAMGFAESTIESVFGDDMDTYADADWDEVPTIPTSDPRTWETAYEEGVHHHELDTNLVAALDDPCYGCKESCDDTACLHANDVGPILGPEDWHVGDGDVE